jgi:metal-sulfur cluster biosynthetic enzyme
MAGVPGIRKANVNIVWEPAWEPSRMSKEARLQLGLDVE